MSVSSHVGVFFFRAIAFLASLSVSIFLIFRELGELDGLISLGGCSFVLLGLLHLTRKSSLREFHRLSIHNLREFNIKLDEHVTEHVVSLVERHSQSSGSVSRVRLDDLARSRLDSNLAAIEMLDCNVYTSKSLEQSNFLVQVKVSSLALEARMLFHRYDNDQISILSSLIRNLVTLPMQSDLIAVGSTLIQLD